MGWGEMNIEIRKRYEEHHKLAFNFLLAVLLTAVGATIATGTIFTVIGQFILKQFDAGATWGRSSQFLSNREKSRSGDCTRYVTTQELSNMPFWISNKLNSWSCLRRRAGQSLVRISQTVTE